MLPAESTDVRVRCVAQTGDDCEATDNQDKDAAQDIGTESDGESN
jgi:hypothetical protein